MSTLTKPQLRPDYGIITDWIARDSQVIDLGCGDGELLRELAQRNGVTGYGVEIDPACIPKCIDNGINVIQTNLNQGLADINDGSFDYVVLSLTLQAMKDPSTLLDEMLRVGKIGIVSFPNFGHWKVRVQLAIMGHMPVSEALPHAWHNTPNIHMCTLHDFENLCARKDITILERRAADHSHQTSLGLRLLPNLLGEIALYRFTRKG